MIRSERFSRMRSIGILGLFGAIALVLSCATGRVRRAPYPHESVLTVFAELKIFLDQDPYRQAPGRDLEGQNVFRVTLKRLDALKGLTDASQSDVIAFGRGQCLARLGAWPEAAEAFEAAAAAQTSIEAEARAQARVCGRMAELTDRTKFTPTLEGYLNDLDVLERRLNQWLAENPTPPTGSLILREREYVQEERVRLLFTNRMVREAAAEQALAACAQLVADNVQSRRAMEHQLMLGSLYETLARDWEARHRADGLVFEGAEAWTGWIEQARAAYRVAAQADGVPVKPEAQARLRALDAYALRVQDLAR